MSKDSIRKQIEKAKKEANEVLQLKSIDKNSILVINSLILLIDIMVSVFLNKKIRKNSSKSGFPPSRDYGSRNNRNKINDQKDSCKKGSQVPNTRTVKEQITSSVDKCKNCGEDLRTKKPLIQRLELKLILFMRLKEKKLLQKLKNAMLVEW